MKKQLITVVCGIALLATPTLAFAASDYFLKLDGVEGESNARGHEKSIEISSWSWGMSNSGSSVGGGGGAGKVNVQDISFTKTFDKATPKLMEKCAKGEHIKDAKITLRSTERGREEYLTYQLEDLVCSSYQVSGSGDRPTESFSMNFSKMTVEYKPRSGGDIVRAILDFALGLF